jgi:hypothetical protein
VTGPTRAPATLAADLAGLSGVATEGQWLSVDHGVRGADGRNWVADTTAGQHAWTDAAYIAALVNAHRAGHLVTLDAALDWVAEQLADPEVVAHLAAETAGYRYTADVLAAALAALRDRAASTAEEA